MTSIAAALLALLAQAQAPTDPKLPEDRLKPGAEIIFDLPALGQSARDPKSPVQMAVYLPKNYAPDRDHPVIVYLGGGMGDRNYAKKWVDLLQGQNFIVMHVDYTLGPGDPGFTNTAAALEVLGRSTKIDRSTVVVSGFSSGAYVISDEYATPNGKLFCAFVMICGGMELNPKQVGDRPVLNIAGESDTQKASAGRARVEVQKSCHAQLTAGGATSDLIVQAGVGHKWADPSFGAVSQWVYSKLPNAELRRLNVLSRLMGRTGLERRKEWYRKMLSETWWQVPGAK